MVINNQSVSSFLSTIYRKNLHSEKFKMVEDAFSILVEKASQVGRQAKTSLVIVIN